MRSEEGKFQNSRRIQGDSGEEKIQGGRVKFKENSRRIQGCINPAKVNSIGNKYLSIEPKDLARGQIAERISPGGR